MQELQVRITSGDAKLDGDLVIPADPVGLVVFAHGSGSSRHSPRNRHVADLLREGRLATLLIDLLTASEEAIDARTAELRFDIALLAGRLTAAVDWSLGSPSTRELGIGLFGSSTGAAAALITAAQRPQRVQAVVSRGGRPDLALRSLGDVRAPTLLIVGGDDEPVIGMNQRAMADMHGQVRLNIVPGATHLFEEPGTLEEVARLAREWFTEHLAGAGRRFKPS